MPDESLPPGPFVIVLGGTGFIGRHLVPLLVGIASRVRVCGKTHPQLAQLSPELMQAFQAPQVEFIQCDLALSAHLKRAFTLPPEVVKSAQTYPLYVINLAAETKRGCDDEVYQQNILGLRRSCANAALAVGRKITRYVEVSTAEVYQGYDKPITEEKAKFKPWTRIGHFHRLAEEYLEESCRELQWVIARLPFVYGPGDHNGLMPRLICASTYAEAGKKMELLWGKSLKCNTVHVRDVAAGLWHLCLSGNPHEAYHIADEGNTDQGSLNKQVSELFGIQTGFINTMMSHLGTKLGAATAEANEDHMEIWGIMTKGLNTCGLSPWIAPEMLQNTGVCLSGSKIKHTGFDYAFKAPTVALLAESIRYWESLGQFPEGYIKAS